MKETKMEFDDINNQSIVSKIDTGIVSIDKEDKPLIYISKEAIYLKRDNDNLRKENNQYKEVLDKIKEKINKQLLSNTNLTKYTDEQCLKDILELLEEIE